MSELESKLNALRGLMQKKNVDVVLLQKVSSFAWATGGSSTAINISSSNGEGALLVTTKDQHLVANNIEAVRLTGEEELGKKGWGVFQFNWWESSKAVETLAPGLRLGSDTPMAGAVDLGAEIARLRAALLPVEQDRIREVSRLCASAMSQAIHAVRPGMTEFEIGSLLAKASLERGLEAIVNLIAVDERIHSYRHPTYTAKKLDRYAMIVLCGRKYGLVVSITRLIYFGKLPAELSRRAEACARVDAAMIAATLPGRTLGQVFSDTQAAYAAVGFDGEWKLHHQGGPAGYEAREFIAVPGSPDVVLNGQAYAWNPSITGVKSEDTVLVTAVGHEVMTEIPGWPVYEIEASQELIKRPKVLEV